MRHTHIYFYIFISLLTSILLIPAFPNPQIPVLAWFAFIPLLFAVDNSTKRGSFLLSYLSGLVFFGGTLYWLTHVTRSGYLILIFYLAFYFGVFGLFCNVFFKGLRTSRFHFTLLILLPSLWISLEFARGILFTGFPWNILGYTQYKNPLIIQIADITGPYGISFVIMSVNVLLYFYLSNLFNKILRSNIIVSRAFNTLGLETLTTAAILASVIIYGHFALNEEDIASGIKLSVVQGNIPQEKKWDPLYIDYIMKRYEMLTKEAAKDKGDLIVWPETAVPGYLDEKDINLWLRRIIKDTGISLFLGAVTYEAEFTEGRDLFFNSAVLFSPRGDLAGRYDKIHLVPFGEYVPFEKYFPFIRNFVNVEIGDFAKGKEFTFFDISKGNTRLKYAALVCFEDIFPNLVREFVKGPPPRLMKRDTHAGKSLDFLINITNEAWFKESDEHMQHAQSSVFRAVENRVGIVRAANTGFSCYINPRGIIEDAIYDIDTKNMYIASFRTFALKVNGRNTFYTRHGDIFAYVCVFLVLGTLIALAIARSAPSGKFDGFSPFR